MVVAVRGGTIREALDNVQGLESKTVIDATNLRGVNPQRASRRTLHS
jgi:hypothetical protein